MSDRYVKVEFRNYKALKSYSITLGAFNVLVGPNNAGKSTIIGAFRILAEGMRKASARKPTYVDHPAVKSMAYLVPLSDLPVATENIFTDYDDSEPATIVFELASGNRMKLIFPESEICYLVCLPTAKSVDTPSAFKKAFDAPIGIVPVLGPVEHNEQLYQKDAARLALLTHGASRNFRNIWLHYPEKFEEFRTLIQATWPGMDIQRPEINRSHEKPVLNMFCPEERYPREIFWAGFGFQVWCQMLTYIVRAGQSALLIVDEPDIYLHSDLQRQLLEILRNIEPDILIATHSTEILTEADPSEILVINKRNRQARRIKNVSQLQSIFGVLGSNLNPTLTQLAKSRRAVFVEGRDFHILSAFARKLGLATLANRSDFAVVPVEGFNPTKVRDFSSGVETTLGTKILKAIVFDRDYRAPAEVSHLLNEFERFAEIAHIHDRKEIENYLFDQNALANAITNRLQERLRRTGIESTLVESMIDVLENLTSIMKSRVQAQYLSKQHPFLKNKDPSVDDTTLNQKILEEFESIWINMDSRIKLVPGKELLTNLNSWLQDKYSISITPTQVISAMKKDEVPEEIRRLLEKLELFRKSNAPSGAA